MLIQLFEAITPLLEINYDKTKKDWVNKLSKRVIYDIDFWRDYRGRLPKDEIVDGSKVGDDYTDEEREALFQFAYNRILEFDPTTGRRDRPSVYALWIIQQYCKETIVGWEDMETISELLVQYDQLKTRNVFYRMADDPEANTTKDWARWVSNINNVKGKAPLAEFVRHGINWLKGKSEHKYEKEFEKYMEWAGRGGIEIAYPQPGIPREQALEMFSKNGMVMTLKSLEASVDLFQAPTAWCTARPGNAYYHGRYGKSPLHVIVDNQNGKLYQYQVQQQTFLNQDDSSQFEVLTIPYPLLVVASELIDEDIPGLAALAGKELDERAVMMMDDAENQPGLSGVNFWEMFRKYNFNNDEDISPRNPALIRLAFARYHYNKRTIPPEDQLFEFIRDHFDSLGSISGYDTLNVSAFIWAIMDYGKPSMKLLTKLIDLAAQTTAAMELLYSTFLNTSAWPQARARLIELLNTGRETDLLGQKVAWESGYMKPGFVKGGRYVGVDPNDFVAAMKFTDAEADHILDNTTTDWNTDIAHAMIYFWRNGVMPRPEHVTHLLNITRPSNIPKETLIQVILTYSLEKYYPLLNLMELLRMKDHRGELIHGFHFGIMMWIAGKDYFLPQITETFLVEVFYNDYGYQRWSKLISDRTAAEWYRSKPEIIHKILELLVARSGTQDWGNLFLLFEPEAFPLITPKDVSDILGNIIDAKSNAFLNVVTRMIKRIEAPRNVPNAQNHLATKPVMDMIVSKVRVAMRQGLMRPNGPFWGTDIIMPYQRVTGEMAPAKLFGDIATYFGEQMPYLISMLVDMKRDNIMYPAEFEQFVVSHVEAEFQPKLSP